MLEPKFLRKWSKQVYSRLHITILALNNTVSFQSGRRLLTLLTSHHNVSVTWIDAVYMDLKAAFDSIDHNILLAKMNKLGLRRNLICWLESYLVNRSYAVSFQQCHSRSFIASSGVPQGSNLGPLLFVLFINDLSYVVPAANHVCLDIKIYMTIKNDTGHSELQQYLFDFHQWCNRNRLSLYIEKCQVTSLTQAREIRNTSSTVNGLPIERTNAMKDLGDILDSKLSFDQQMEEMITRGNQLLGMLFRITRDLKDPVCIKAL